MLSHHSTLVALQLLIICSNKSVLTIIPSGWNLIFGVSSLLYLKDDALRYLLKIFNPLFSVSASRSLRLIQKYLLSSLIFVSKSHLKQFFLVISNRRKIK